MPNAKKYTVTVEVNREVHTAKTDDIADAIRSLPIGVIKTKVIVTVSTKTATFSQVLIGRAAQRLFKNKLTPQIFAKHMELALKGK